MVDRLRQWIAWLRIPKGRWCRGCPYLELEYDEQIVHSWGGTEYIIWCKYRDWLCGGRKICGIKTKGKS